MSRATRSSSARTGLQAQLPFVIEEPALALDAAAIAGEGAVGPDHAMTGDDHADGVGAVGQADSANGAGPADARGKLRVGDCGPARDLAEGAPYLALERSACGGDGKGVDGMEVAGKVACQSFGQAVRIVSRMQFDLRAGVVMLEKTLQVVGTAGTEWDVGPEGCAQVPFVIGDQEQLADGGEKAVKGKWQNLNVRPHREIFSLAIEWMCGKATVCRESR